MKVTMSSYYRVPELNYMKYIARRQNNFQVVIRTYFGLELSHLSFLVVGVACFLSAAQPRNHYTETILVAILFG